MASRIEKINKNLIKIIFCNGSIEHEYPLYITINSIYSLTESMKEVSGSSIWYFVVGCGSQQRFLFYKSQQECNSDLQKLKELIGQN